MLIRLTVTVRGAVKIRGFPSKHQPVLNYIALSCMYDDVILHVINFLTTKNLKNRPSPPHFTVLIPSDVGEAVFTRPRPRQY